MMERPESADKIVGEVDKLLDIEGAVDIHVEVGLEEDHLQKIKIISLKNQFQYIITPC